MDIRILLDGTSSLIVRNVSRYSFKNVFEKLFLYVETANDKRAYFPAERVICVGDIDILL